MDKLDEWKRWLQQASEYGMFFDKATVSEMVELIENQKEKIRDLNESLFTERMKNEGLEIQVSELKEEKSLFLEAYKDKVMNEK